MTAGNSPAHSKTKKVISTFINSLFENEKPKLIRKNSSDKDKKRNANKIISFEEFLSKENSSKLKYNINPIKNKTININKQIK